MKSLTGALSVLRRFVEKLGHDEPIKLFAWDEAPLYEGAANACARVLQGLTPGQHTIEVFVPRQMGGAPATGWRRTIVVMVDKT